MFEAKDYFFFLFLFVTVFFLFEAKDSSTPLQEKWSSPLGKVLGTQSPNAEVDTVGVKIFVVFKDKKAENPLGQTRH